VLATPATEGGRAPGPASVAAAPRDPQSSSDGGASSDVIGGILAALARAI